MAEEPEQVLEQVGAAAGAGEEEGGLNAAVEGDHQQGGDQHRRRKHHQDRGAEGGPAEDRQAAPGQARRAHGDDRGDQVQPQEGHRDTDQGEEEDVGVEAVVGLVVERGVSRPTGWEATEEDRRDEDRPGRHQQPEGERLDPGEGHPPRADHQRHEVVGERAEDARSHHSHHHRAVQAYQRQVVAGIEDLRRGTQQLGPNQHRVEAGDEKEEADPEQVLDPDDLVVGAEPEVAADAARLVLEDGSLATDHPAQRVAGEAEADQKTDHGKQVSEHQRDVVLVRVSEVVEAFGVDLMAQPPAEVEADDQQDDAREEVEADQAPPERPCRRTVVHPALLSGSGK